MYGYKVCYKQQGKSKYKIYVIVNTYNLAQWHIRWYEKQAPPNLITPLPNNIEWLIIPIKTNTEYKRLWRGCPF